MATAIAENDTKPKSLFDGFIERKEKCGDVLLYALPSETTVEDMVHEIIKRNLITGIYLVPQSLYHQRKLSAVVIPDIYEIPVLRPDVLRGKSFSDLRGELGYEVVNFANLVHVLGEEKWIPNMDLCPMAKTLPINFLAQELVVEIGLGDGFLVDSGAGLHFWGLHTVSYDAWHKMFLAAHNRRRKKDMIVDGKWLFQLSNYTVGPYTLRVTDWQAKDKPVPKPLYYCQKR